METPKHEVQRPMGADEPQATTLTPTSFAAIYRAQVVPLFRYFSQHTGNTADAEDLTAATVGKALASLSSYAGRGTLAAVSPGSSTLAPLTVSVERRSRPASCNASV